MPQATTTCRWMRLLRGSWLWCWLWAMTTAWAQPSLLLDERQPSVAAWSAVSLLVDPGAALTLAEVRLRAADFKPAGKPTANLGPRRDAIWMRLPLAVAAGDGRWVLDIDYPPLNEAVVYQFSNGRLVGQYTLGAQQHFSARPMASRSHAVLLDLSPGQPHELYLRVKTDSAMVLPISLNREDAFRSREEHRQLVQGVMLGVALALLVYCLAHWLSLRNALFGFYAVMLLGTTVFFLDFFGILQQHLQYARVGLLASLSPLSVLMALPAGGLFVARALDTPRHAPRVHRTLLLLSGLAAISLVLALAGLLDYPTTQKIATLLGPLVPMLMIPVALARARQGDRAALFMLLGWSAYVVGAFVLAGLLRGWLPANALTLNFFQWGTLVEMLAWLRVLGLHIETVRRQAQRVEVERQALESLAYTDALTGLPNRRGLQRAMAQALGRPRPAGLLAVYLLDLDGFKAVNDRLGHDGGDELLCQVAGRLQAQLRQGDLVARLGGDEFVVMAEDLATEADAGRVGDKLLDAFSAPFVVQDRVCRVGMTAGYALAPNDGADGADLLRRADTAMYAGKQAGRHCLRRAGASMALATVG